jgi:hypothetical protein
MQSKLYHTQDMGDDNDLGLYLHVGKCSTMKISVIPGIVNPILPRIAFVWESRKWNDCEPAYFYLFQDDSKGYTTIQSQHRKVIQKSSQSLPLLPTDMIQYTFKMNWETGILRWSKKSYLGSTKLYSEKDSASLLNIGVYSLSLCLRHIFVSSNHNEEDQNYNKSLIPGTSWQTTIIPASIEWEKHRDKLLEEYRTLQSNNTNDNSLKQLSTFLLLCFGISLFISSNKI